MATQVEIDALTLQVDALQTSINSLSTLLSDVSLGENTMWILVCSFLIFFMQGGFALLEIGSVHSKSFLSILYKNLIATTISAISFWILGYGFAFGNTKGRFIGVNKFGLSGADFDVGNGYQELEYQSFFFQWSLAAVTVAVVNGSVSERCKLETYLIYATAISLWIYPIVVHWCWGQGWLSPFAAATEHYLFYGHKSNNFIDSAGSAVVHTVGGLSGLVAAIALGPRKGRFNANGTMNQLKTHQEGGSLFIILGTAILWLGWYGFAPGSTHCMAGSCSSLAAKIAAVITIAGASACLTMVCYQFYYRCYRPTELQPQPPSAPISLLTDERFCLYEICRAIIAGLVSISAACAVVDLWAAMIIGIAGCLIYIKVSKLLRYFRIDDPSDSSVIHGACGIWGTVAVGIFGNDDNAAFAGYLGSSNGFHPFRTGEQFGVQLVGIICITAWTIGSAGFLFYMLKYTVGIRTGYSGNVITKTTGNGHLGELVELARPATSPANPVNVSSSMETL